MTGVWKILTSGTSLADNHQFSLGQETEKLVSMLRRPQTLSDKTELVRLTVRELGFPSGEIIESIYIAAQASGLTLCTASLGMLLRENYVDQPLGEQLNIAMIPISVSHIRNFAVKGRLIQEKDKATAILCVGRSDRINELPMLYLRGSSMQTFWKPDAQFVFVLNASRK